jgi:hypothetical protein
MVVVGTYTNRPQTHIGTNPPGAKRAMLSVSRVWDHDVLEPQGLVPMWISRIFAAQVWNHDVLGL